MRDVIFIITGENGFTMRLPDILHRGWQRLRSDGVGETVYLGYLELLKQFSFFTDPDYLSEQEWEILLVFDGCRADTLFDFDSDFDFLQDKKTITSANSMTKRWMEANFTGERAASFANTSYVCGNPYSKKVLSDTTFESLIEVWDTHWDEELGTIRPRPITDAAIDEWRNEKPERMIVHYMQPHYPFINYPSLESKISHDDIGEDGTYNIWHKLRFGHVSEELVREAYLDNLRLVLSDVEMFLSAVDADDVVITSDHGNAFGEYGVYGHPPDMPISCLRTVPWVRTSASNNHEYTPELATQEQTGEVAQRLSDLGYLE